MKTGAELDERRDTADHPNRSARRLGDAGHELQRRALAGAVLPDDTVGRSFGHAEGDVAERRERFARPQVAQDAALQERALQRRKLTAAIPPVDFRDVGELDGRRHTTSANESGRRSKSQYAARNCTIE